MYKVFVNNYPYFFVSEQEEINENLPVFNNKPFNRINDIITSSQGAILRFSNPESAWKYFSQNYRLIDAAGGVVHYQNNILLIFRNGKWDLPKGKIDAGETPEQAAIREIKEECGIKDDLKIEKPLLETYHTYTAAKQQAVLKKTYWFSIAASKKSALVPQIEEGIEEVKWVKKDELDKYLKNTYGSIRDVLECFLKLSV